MSRLALQRCWNHTAREAVAKCPECGRFFCRECVVEHSDRLICNACLAREQGTKEKPKRRLSFAPVLQAGAAVLGLIFAWILFFSAGRMLLDVPDQFHADTLWKRTLGDDFHDGYQP